MFVAKPMSPKEYEDNLEILIMAETSYLIKFINDALKTHGSTVIKILDTYKAETYKRVQELFKRAGWFDISFKNGCIKLTKKDMNILKRNPQVQGK